MNGRYAQRISIAGMGATVIASLAGTVFGLARYIAFGDQRAGMLLLIASPLFALSLIALNVMLFAFETDENWTEPE